MKHKMLFESFFNAFFELNHFLIKENPKNSVDQESLKKFRNSDIFIIKTDSFVLIIC